MSTLALLLALSLGGSPARFFEGEWTCRVPKRGQLKLKVVRADPKRPKNRLDIKTDTFELFAEGAASKLLPATAAMMTADRGNTFLSLSGTGVCAPPGPIGEDDAPGSGAPRCARFEATADGWYGEVLHWKLTGQKTSGARYALLVDLARAGASGMKVTVKNEHGAALAQATCHRVPSPSRKHPKTRK
jgi:hypothetical protein